jgi:hypothetical protein
MKEPSKSDIRYWQNRLFRHARQTDGKKYIDADWSIRIAYDGRREKFLPRPTTSTKQPEKRGLFTSDWWPSDGRPRWQSSSRPKRSSRDAAMPPLAIFWTRCGNFMLPGLKRSKAMLSPYGRLPRIFRASRAEGRGGNPANHCEWRKKVESLPLSALTPVRIQAWKESFLARAGSDPLKQRVARVSVTSFLRRARSLFAQRMIERLEDIILPDPLPFAGIRLEKRSMPRYQSSFDVVQLVVAAQEKFVLIQNGFVGINNTRNCPKLTRDPFNLRCSPYSFFERCCKITLA